MNEKILVPPFKIQGIKTKLIPFIKEKVMLDKETLWIEPFMGSGVVGMNVAPRNALFSDLNPHIVNFYNLLNEKELDSKKVRLFLEKESENLSKGGQNYYNEVRHRFNELFNPLDFLFLNRSCFNGMIRFNKRNKFNVPFCHKNDRFSKSYITKIVNQVYNLERLLNKNNWKFMCSPFEDTIAEATENSFIYCDPPYIGRHIDYYDSWDEENETLLKNCLLSSNSKFMLSTWYKNKYRENEYVNSIWLNFEKSYHDHFYFLGAKETNRNSITEVLLTNYIPCSKQNLKYSQISLGAI